MRALRNVVVKNQINLQIGIGERLKSCATIADCTASHANLMHHLFMYVSGFFSSIVLLGLSYSGEIIYTVILISSNASNILTPNFKEMIVQ